MSTIIILTLYILIAGISNLQLGEQWNLWPYLHYGDAWENIRNGFLMSKGWYQFSDIPFVHTPGVPSYLHIAFELYGVGGRAVNSELAKLLETISIIATCIIQIFTLRIASRQIGNLIEANENYIFWCSSICFTSLSVAYRLYLPMSESLVGLISLISFIELCKILKFLNNSSKHSKDSQSTAIKPGQVYTSFCLIALYSSISLSIGLTNLFGQGAIIIYSIVSVLHFRRKHRYSAKSTLSTIDKKSLIIPVIVLIALNLRTDHAAMIYWFKYFSDGNNSALTSSILSNFRDALSNSSIIPFNSLIVTTIVGTLLGAKIFGSNQYRKWPLVALPYISLFIFDNWRITADSSAQSYKAEFNWVCNLFILSAFIISYIYSKNSERYSQTKQKSFSRTILIKENIVYFAASILILSTLPKPIIAISSAFKGELPNPPTATVRGFEEIYKTHRPKEFSDLGIKRLSDDAGKYCAVNLIWDTKFNIVNDVKPCRGLWAADPAGHFFKLGSYSNELVNRVIEDRSVLIYPHWAKNVEEYTFIKDLRRSRKAEFVEVGGNIFVRKKQ